jgi:hypothetical protein
LQRLGTSALDQNIFGLRVGLDDVAVAVLPVVEESEVGADRMELILLANFWIWHKLTVRGAAPILPLSGGKPTSAEMAARTVRDSI